MIKFKQPIDPDLLSALSDTLVREGADAETLIAYVNGARQATYLALATPTRCLVWPRGSVADSLLLHHRWSLWYEGRCPLGQGLLLATSDQLEQLT